MAIEASSPAQELTSAPTHPEEMKTVFDLRIGKFATLQGSARITPAGVVTAGISATAILLGVAAVIRASRRS